MALWTRCSRESATGTPPLESAGLIEIRGTSTGSAATSLLHYHNLYKNASPVTTAVLPCLGSASAHCDLANRKGASRWRGLHFLHKKRAFSIVLCASHQGSLASWVPLNMLRWAVNAICKYINAIDEKALNPCHILIQAIPKRQLLSKEEILSRILD